MTQKLTGEPCPNCEGYIVEIDDPDFPLQCTECGAGFTSKTEVINGKEAKGGFYKQEEHSD